METLLNVSTENSTDENNPEAALVVITISVIAILGNSLVLVAIITNQDLREQLGNLLVFNLSAADLMTAVFSMLPSAVSLFFGNWRFEKNACYAHMAVTFTLFSVSNTTLAAISYDRSLALTRALCYTEVMTLRKIKSLIAYSWTQGITLAFIPAFVSEICYDKGEAVCTVCFDIATFPQKFYTWIATAVCFGIPSALLIFYNFKILLSVRQLRTVTFQIPSQSSCAKEPCNKRSSKNFFRPGEPSVKKTLCTLYLLTVTFLISAAPRAYIKITKSLVDAHNVPSWMSLFTTVLQFSSAAINPFIYAILRKDYRNAFTKCFNTMFIKLKLKKPA